MSSAMGARSAREVLEFWFSERSRPLWFERNQAFDEEIRNRFAATLEPAAAGALDGWMIDPDSSLALVIVLDQFSRNLHRGSPRAFAADPKARGAADLAIQRGFDQRQPLDRRHFFYLPFEHSEHPADQRRSVQLFQRWADAHDDGTRDQAYRQLMFVHRHAEIIDRFGRFPHRNECLGRESTPQEIEFLGEPHSSF
ncbi:MAG: DUF924 family protein [Dongiaceae bacterium]